MDRWLPPQAPGAGPPPRFEPARPDHERPDEGAPGADDAQPDARGAAGDAAAAGRSAAPAGWAPPTPQRDLMRAPTPARPTAPAAAPPPRAATPPSALAAGAERPNPTAAWALVLGIAGIVLLLLSFGTLFLVTLPCSAGAWALGRRAARRIERGETGRGGGQASAALWLGRIGVLVGVAAMVAFVVLTLSGVDLEQLREDLQRDLERRRDAAR
jgi:hypothetical protein